MILVFFIIIPYSCLSSVINLVFQLYMLRTMVPPEQSKLYQTLKQGDDRRKTQLVQSKLQVSLFKHKELLKKDILKKRALLEKELQVGIQVCTLSSCFSSEISV